MSRRRRRLIITIVVLTLLLALVAVAAINYNATKHFGFEVQSNPANTVTPPEFLYSFAGLQNAHLEQPVGILRTANRVYVADAVAARVFVFNPAGRLLTTFGGNKVITPLYIAQNPLNGNLYISDRRLRSVQIFSPDGKFVGTFNPHLPKSELPRFNTHGTQWLPIAIAFAPDGTMYVTEILNGHRLLIFSPQGKFLKSVGHAGSVASVGDGPLEFQFPNSIKVLNNQVYVVDSNNGRIQVLDKNGKFLRFIPTNGLPRGMAFLPRRAGESAKTPDNFVVIDALSHQASIFDVTGGRLLDFGAQGVLDGQFMYPDDVSVDAASSRMFITDTSNARVQVWGWPAQAEPIPTPHTPVQWAWCLSPLLLLLLPLFFRRRRFFATKDFVDAMFAAEKIYTMPGGRRRWLVMPADYEALKDLVQGEVNLGELLNVAEYSESDMRNLMERYELPEELAGKMAVAQRAKVTCTEDAEVRRVARVLELDVVNMNEYLARFAKNGQTPPTDGDDIGPVTTTPTVSSESDVTTEIPPVQTAENSSPEQTGGGEPSDS